MKYCLVAVLAAVTSSASAAPVPKDGPPTGVIVYASGYFGVPLRLFSPTGGPLRELEGIKERTFLPLVSPDRKKLAFFVEVAAPRDPKADPFTRRTAFALHVVDLDGKEKLGEPLASGFAHGFAAWVPDSKTVYVTDFSRDVPLKEGGGYRSFPGDVTECEVATGKSPVIDALRGHQVVEVAANGKLLLANKFLGDDGKTEKAAFARDGWKTVPLADYPADTRPRLVQRRIEPDPKAAVQIESEYALVDPKTKVETPVELPAEIDGKEVRLSGVHLSPDGRHLLFVWLERVPAPDDWVPKEWPCMATRLTVTRTDGTGAKTIYRPEVKTRADQLKTHFMCIEWR